MSESKDEQTEILREIAKWSRFMGFKQVKEVLEAQLKDKKKILAYHLSDGKNTSTIISKATGINQPKITELWKDWLSVGLGESISASGGGRFKRSFDLKMFGIDVPELQKPEKESKIDSNETIEQTTGSEENEQQ